MVYKNTVNRWTDIKFVVTPAKKTRKIPITTDKEMFSPSPDWKVVDSDKPKKSHSQKEK